MFFGFNTAVKGLLASQRGLYTTNHNITNKTTPGYSKQYIDQKSTKAHHLPGIGYIGTGTEIVDIKRMRDSFTDKKYWHEMSPYGDWNIKSESLLEIQKIMGEPSDTSFRQYLDDFYTTLEDMSKNPGDTSFRQPVLENAKSFAEHIKDVNNRLSNHKKESIFQLETIVKDINQLSDQISLLNRQIYIKELDGHIANDLRDKRGLLIDDLSQLVDINVSETPEGRLDISISGTSLVNHQNSNHLVVNSDVLKGEKEGDIVSWNNGARVRYRSGEIKGLVENIVGDGRDGSYRGIPFYQEQISKFTKGFADKFNEQHRKGYDLNGEEGLNFFIYDEESPSGTLEINLDILKDIGKIAGSSSPDNGIENAENILELIKQREDRNFFDFEGYPKGTPDDFMKSIMSSMAVDSKHSDRFLETQKLIKQNLINKRESISGVDMNEEMADLIKFQRVYTASSKMINTLDALLDVTINRLGLVGR